MPVRDKTANGNAISEELLHFTQSLRWEPGQELKEWLDGFYLHFRQLLADLEVLQMTYYQYLPQQRLLQFVNGYAAPADVKAQIPLGIGMVGQAGKSGQPVYLGANGEQCSFRATASMFSLAARASVVHPLLHNGQLLGVLEFTTLEDVTEQHKPLIAYLCATLAAHLHSIQNQIQVQALLAEAQSRNLELERHEHQLNEKIRQLNTLQNDLRDAQAQLEEANHNLEDEVRARTSELAGALEELKGAQHQLITSEKMAALGQLVAGVAHEINSPIGAIKGSSAVLMDAIAQLVDTFPKMAELVPPRLMPDMKRLLDEILQGKPQFLNPSEERKLRKVFAAEIGSWGLEEPMDIARDLVGAGFYGRVEDYKTLFMETNPTAVAAMIYNLGLLKVNVENISLAADKTKKVVFALKSYSHTQEPDIASLVDLRENVDTVLTLYTNQLKYSVELTADLNTVPSIQGYPDELSQVWTNLIQNALQAMGGEGRMAVRVYQRDSDWVAVEIEDGGPGIPSDIQQKIFEPFFTTKKRGEGTGLGLDICKKIVEKHRGRMALKSEPGCTVFTVLLPIAG